MPCTSIFTRSRPSFSACATNKIVICAPYLVYGLLAQALEARVHMEGVNGRLSRACWFYNHENISVAATQLIDDPSHVESTNVIHIEITIAIF